MNMSHGYLYNKRMYRRSVVTDYNENVIVKAFNKATAINSMSSSQ